MGLTKTSDGRYLVGQGIEDADNYKGSQGYRDLVIQLTSDGATDASFEKLNYLRDYAIYHSGQGNPVMPPSVSVWISNNGTTTAVEADDISYTDGVYTICGIKYENGAWDFTNAGQGGGGGSSLPPYTSADKGKVLTVVDDNEHSTSAVAVPEQSVTITDGETLVAVSDVDASLFVVGYSGIITVNGTDYNVTCSDFGGGCIGYMDMTCPVGFLLDGGVVQAGPVGGAGTYTVKLTVNIPAVKDDWVISHYDIIIDAGSGSSDTTYNQAKAMLENGVLVRVLIYANGSIYKSGFAVAAIHNAPKYSLYFMCADFSNIPYLFDLESLTSSGNSPDGILVIA